MGSGLYSDEPIRTQQATIPALPDNYDVQYIPVQPEPSILPLRNPRPLVTQPAELNQTPLFLWILLGIIALGAIGLLALALVLSSKPRD